MSPNFSAIIDKARRKLGARLTILAHHYQDDAVVRHADHVGDSLELARKIPGLDSDYIVFCGVYFMAETAAILAKPGQKVIIPDAGSNCVMSEMAPAALVKKVLSRLGETGRDILGLTYVNSSAAVKAVCGETGGSVCTSANAERMLSWAMSQGKRTLFLPDQMLAHNTCDSLGVAPSRRMLLDIRQGGNLVDVEAAKNADILIWPGRCVIHSRFKPERIRKIKSEEPEALVAVHPECSPQTVAEADDAGSTSRIIRFVSEAPLGATIHIGTEWNLVDRLAREYQGKKTIKPLAKSLCSNMAKNTEEKLARVLENLDAEPATIVAEDIAKSASLAINRMLEICS